MLLLSFQHKSVIANPKVVSTNIEAIRADTVSLSRRYAKLSARLHQLDNGDHIVVDTATYGAQRASIQGHANGHQSAVLVGHGTYLRQVLVHESRNLRSS